MEAIKAILRYRLSRNDNGLAYDHKGPLKIKCFPSSDNAADTDRRRSVHGILLKESGMVLVCEISRQATITQSSSENKYVCAYTGALILVCMSSLEKNAYHLNNVQY